MGACAPGAPGGPRCGRARGTLTDAQLDGVGVVGPTEQEANEHHRDPVQHPSAPPPDAARARGRHLPAASTCPAPPPPPPAGLAPGWAGRARRPRRDRPGGGGRLRCGHCRRRGAKSPSRSPKAAPRTPDSSARRRLWLPEEGREGGGGGRRGGGGSRRPAPPASPGAAAARSGRLSGLSGPSGSRPRAPGRRAAQGPPGWECRRPPWPFAFRLGPGFGVNRRRRCRGAGPRRRSGSGWGRGRALRGARRSGSLSGHTLSREALGAEELTE